MESIPVEQKKKTSDFNIELFQNVKKDKNGRTITHPQFHPSNALELLAVVLAKRKTPVSPILRERSLNNETT